MPDEDAGPSSSCGEHRFEIASVTLQAVVAVFWPFGMTEAGHIPDNDLKLLAQGADHVIPGGAVSARAMGEDDRGCIFIGAPVPLDVQVRAVRAWQTGCRIGLKGVRFIGATGMKREHNPPAQERQKRHHESGDEVARADNNADIPRPQQIEAAAEDSQRQQAHQPGEQERERREEHRGQGWAGNVPCTAVPTIAASRCKSDTH